MRLFEPNGYSIIDEMAQELLLTAKEITIFERVSAPLREGWKVSTETLDCYESAKQLHMRYNMADFTMAPEMKTWADRAKKGEDLKDFSLDTVGVEFQKELFFVLGAKGVNGIIQVLLGNIRNDDDVQALAELTAVRHKLLEINRSATIS